MSEDPTPRTRSSSISSKNSKSSKSNEEYPIITEEKKNILISSISSIMIGIILFNKDHQNEIQPNTSDILFSKRIPLLTIEDYLKRLIKYSKMENSTIVIMFIYLDRIFLKEKFVLCLNNVYRIILACMVLSIKYNEDSKFKNNYYCKIGGISLADMNAIEASVYIRLNFEMFISPEEYLYYYNKLLNFEEESEIEADSDYFSEKEDKKDFEKEPRIEMEKLTHNLRVQAP